MGDIIWYAAEELARIWMNVAERVAIRLSVRPPNARFFPTAEAAAEYADFLAKCARVPVELAAAVVESRYTAMEVISYLREGGGGSFQYSEVGKPSEYKFFDDFLLASGAKPGWRWWPGSWVCASGNEDQIAQLWRACCAVFRNGTETESAWGAPWRRLVQRHFFGEWIVESGPSYRDGLDEQYVTLRFSNNVAETLLTMPELDAFVEESLRLGVKLRNGELEIRDPLNDWTMPSFEDVPWPKREQ